MQVFRHKDYRDLIKEQFDLRRGVRGLKSKAATAAGIHPSFISQVIHGASSLNVDQAVKLSEFFNLNDVETEFFTLLVRRERAGSAVYRNRLEKQIAAMQKEHLSPPKILDASDAKAPGFTIDEQMAFYSFWVKQAVYVMCTLPGQTDSSALSKRLHMPQKAILGALKSLKELGFIEGEEGAFKLTRKRPSFEKDSPINTIYQHSWRKRAIRALEEGNDDGIHVSYQFVLDNDHFEHLLNTIRVFIKDLSKDVKSSPQKELVCLNIDFFKV